MTHPSVNSIVERLEYLSSPAAESLSEYQRINAFVKAGCEAATIISDLQAERERDKLYWNGRCVDLQVNAHGWMKAHDQLLGFIQSKPELLKSLIDEKFAIKYPSPADVPEILQRALAAESSLSRIKAETIEECARVAKVARKAANAKNVSYNRACEDIASAIRSLGSTGGGEP